MKIYETLDHYPSQDEINNFVKLKQDEGYKLIGSDMIRDDMETLEGKHPKLKRITLTFEK